MKQTSLQILDKLVKPEAQRQRRLTDLLRPPDVAAVDWFMFVPTCFNAALDIQQTVRVIEKQETLQWTQGSTFSFSVGDIIYNTPKAYEKWSEALKHIRFCIHVIDATPVAPASASAQRKPGRLAFDLLIPNEAGISLMRSSKHDMTQDEFIRLLIAGTSAQLTLSSPDTLL
jgi:hypothetical protein